MVLMLWLICVFLRSGPTNMQPFSWPLEGVRQLDHLLASVASFMLSYFSHFLQSSPVRSFAPFRQVSQGFKSEFKQMYFSSHGLSRQRGVAILRSSAVNDEHI